MSFINVQLFYDSIDITSYIISYERVQDICSGQGFLKVILNKSYLNNLSVWHTITLKEGGVQKGIYYIETMDYKVNSVEVELTCQDGSLKIADYFIPNKIYVEYPSTAKSWMIEFLDDALVDYVFDTTDEGSMVNNETIFGPESLRDVMDKLLQENGWYLAFDSDNIAHIGYLNINPENYTATINDTNILNMSTSKDDKMLRNRVIIWGSGQPTNKYWVWGEATKFSGYEVDNKDIRTILFNMGNVADNDTANSIAQTVVREFSKLTYTKNIELSGSYSIKIGDVIYVNSIGYTGFGLVTTIGSSMSKSGLVTHIVLDERCPRLVAHYTYQYVFVGTTDSGIWRKSILYEDAWTDFSEGLTDLSISDLFVYFGTFCCIAGGHLYTRTTKDTAWTIFHPGTFTDIYAVDPEKIEYLESEVIATGCVINRTTGEIITAYTSLPNTRSWTVIVSPEGKLIKTIQIVNSVDNRQYRTFDVDIYADKIVTTGICNITPGNVIDLPKNAYFTTLGQLSARGTGSWPSTKWPYVKDGCVYQYTISGGHIFVKREDYNNNTHITVTSTSYITPSSLVNLTTGPLYVIDKDNIIASYRNISYGPSKDTWYRYSYSFTTDTFTFLDSIVITGYTSAVPDYLYSNVGYDVRDGSYTLVPSFYYDASWVGTVRRVAGHYVRSFGSFSYNGVDTISVYGTEEHYNINTHVLTKNENILLDSIPCTPAHYSNVYCRSFGTSVNPENGYFSTLFSIFVGGLGINWIRSYILENGVVSVTTAINYVNWAHTNIGGSPVHTNLPSIQTNTSIGRLAGTLFSYIYAPDSTKITSKLYGLSSVDCVNNYVFTISPNTTRHVLELQIYDSQLNYLSEIDLYTYPSGWNWVTNPLNGYMITEAFASEDVLFIEITRFDAYGYVIGTPTNYYYVFGNPKDVPEPPGPFGGGSYEVLQQNGNKFDTIYSPGGATKLENSQNSPLMVYAYPADGVLASGLTLPSISIDNDWYRTFAYSCNPSPSGLFVTTVAPDFNHLASGPTIIRHNIDARVYYDQNDDPADTSVREYIWVSSLRHPMIDPILFDKFDGDFANIGGTIITDNVYAIETSNNIYPNQYLFMSTYANGISNFYQRIATQPIHGFVLDNGTAPNILPNSKITIIRTDDRL